MLVRSLPVRFLALGWVLLIVVSYLTFDRSAVVDHGRKIASKIAPTLGYSYEYSDAFSDSSESSENHDEYLAVCVTVKNGQEYMDEWFKHHYHSMGIRRFYVLDNASDPPMSLFTSSFNVPQEALTFMYYDKTERGDKQAKELQMYKECAENYGRNNTWLAFMEADEFFDTPGGQTIHDVLYGLEPLRHIGALGVNWKVHNSNGRLRRPKSLRKAYTKCVDNDDAGNGGTSINRYYKSIVRTSAFEAIENGYSIRTNNDSVLVGEFADPIKHLAFRQPITHERLALHKYAVKSKEEFEESIKKADGSTGPNDAQSREFRDAVEKAASVDCMEMLRWVAEEEDEEEENDEPVE